MVTGINGDCQRSAKNFGTRQQGQWSIEKACQSTTKLFKTMNKHGEPQ